MKMQEEGRMLKHKTQDACQMQKPYLDPDSSEPTVKRHQGDLNMNS